jgi:predicted DNA-binding antitoxin AbrB/MazE fold protein
LPSVSCGRQQSIVRAKGIDAQLANEIEGQIAERVSVMTITVEATYENGVLKPSQPLPLKERERVQVTVCRPSSVADETYGIIGWSGDADTFTRLLQEADADGLEHG